MIGGLADKCPSCLGKVVLQYNGGAENVGIRVAAIDDAEQYDDEEAAKTISKGNKGHGHHKCEPLYVQARSAAVSRTRP